LVRKNIQASQFEKVAYAIFRQPFLFSPYAIVLHSTHMDASLLYYVTMPVSPQAEGLVVLRHQKRKNN
jgi:hypothetical protein